MRIQAFEFMDLPQTPHFLRDSVVESLGNALRWSGVYRRATPSFKKFLANLPDDKLLDLCSGSGEPAAILLEALKQENQKLPRFLLSDLFPVIHEMQKVLSKFPQNIEAINEPLDATDVSDIHQHSGRVISSAFHHFPPELAKSILKDSAEKGKPILILEPMTRNAGSAVKIGIFFLFANMVNPILSERDKLLKAAFTYLFPLIPAMAAWDGLISIGRMYNKAEYLELVTDIDADFNWEFELIKGSWGETVSVFSGTPKPKTKHG